MDAYVSLGELDPSDVTVELVHGRVTHSDSLTEPVRKTLDAAEAYEGGRYRYSGPLQLRRTGAFGYTVRVLPSHRSLVSVAEMGLVVNAG